MDKTEFFKHAKIGDTIDLKSGLIPFVKYGDTTYRKEMEKYGVKGLRISMLFPEAGRFMTEECIKFTYSPEMVEKLIPQPTQDETIAESFIKNVGENQAAEIIDTLLEPGDKVRIKKNINIVDDLWGCNYIYGHMLLPGEEAEIVDKLDNSEYRTKGERYVLEKNHIWVYSTPMFDLVYTIAKNEHIFETIKEMYNQSSNGIDPKRSNIMESQDNEGKIPSPQDNDTLNELKGRLIRVESNIKLIKEQIERIGTILLNP